MSEITGTAALNNYVDAQNAAKTSTTAAAETDKSLWGDFDTFLQLLTAQLQNQDPTDPADASEFTQQLVQYSQVEQQISTNDKLDAISTTINSNGITPLLSYVGQHVEVKADGEMLVQNGQGMMAYNLPEEALNVSVSVQDDKGNSIAMIEGPTAKGLNRVLWDGKLADGTQAENGTYKYVLTAKDNKDNNIEVTDVRVIGQVTGIETNESGEVEMKIGEMSLTDKDIMSVFAAVGSAPES